VGGFTVKYFLGATGTTDITPTVEAGIHASSTLAPGAITGNDTMIRIEIFADKAVPKGTPNTFALKFTSVSDPTKVDVVKAKVTGPPKSIFRLPDLSACTLPLTSAVADAAFPAAAPADAASYRPKSSLMLDTSEKLPIPSRMSVLPAVRPPPLTESRTAAFWPLSQRMVPAPLAVL